MSNDSPCLTCGACCAYFRVSFYWGEAQSAGGCVPDNLTEQVTPHLICMQGTNAKPSRCTALMGDVGSQVRCTIYESRPSPCRNFLMSGENNSVNTDCDKARAYYGLPPIYFPADRESDVFA